ncbi:phosphatidylglycerophosphatase A [Pelagovum sp. HNIBRBA483]|uniref:phosphatidylglycerophosphatase A family protein n=1 Tax=Pelagovum sp. HNIBRBA483 TaxID=3233341 RepID=UPI0034A3E2AA
MNKLIATVCYTGYLRPAPGTWGSLAALPLAWLIYEAGGYWLLIVLGVVVFFAGVKATEHMAAETGDHDPSCVVVDEVVGQWVALLPVVIGASNAQVEITALWPGWVAAFILFRLFDIWKPGPIGWADRKETAVGVMLDDVFAGIFASIGVVVLAGVAHLWLM